jgi:hypothetical protein
MPTLRILYIECITTGTGLFWKENDKAFSKLLGKILDAQNRLLGTAGAVTGFTPLNVLKDAVNSAGDVWKEVTDLIESLGLDGSDDFYISLSDQERQQKVWPLQEDYFELGNQTPRITLDLPIPYDRTITVYFWERDTGSDDDILGSLSVISHELAGRGGEPDTATGIFVGSKQENSLYYIVFSVFVVGLDGRIWSKFYDPRIADAKWSDWFPLGDNTFPPTSVVTAISGVPGGVTLFVIGHDRKVWSQYYDPRVENPAWSGWFELGGGVSPETTNVSAVSSLPGAASLFVVGLDGRIWSKFYDPRIADAKWSDWFPLGDNTFPPTSVVTAISGVPGGVTLFVVGHDRKVWSQYYDPRVENPAWSGWFPL